MYFATPRAFIENGRFGGRPPGTTVKLANLSPCVRIERPRRCGTGCGTVLQIRGPSYRGCVAPNIAHMPGPTPLDRSCRAAVQRRGRSAGSAKPPHARPVGNRGPPTTGATRAPQPAPRRGAACGVLRCAGCASRLRAGGGAAGVAQVATENQRDQEYRQGPHTSTRMLCTSASREPPQAKSSIARLVGD